LLAASGGTADCFGGHRGIGARLPWVVGPAGHDASRPRRPAADQHVEVGEEAAGEPEHGSFLDAAAIGPDEQVLDIGCGTGQTARDAARRAASGGAPIRSKP